MADAIVAWLALLIGIEGISFTVILGWLFWPIAFLMGVPPGECTIVGQLLGLKTASNEFVAYSQLSKYIRDGTLSPRAIVIATYALCGFANLGSMGIMVGGLSTMAPHKRAILSREVPRALIAGTLACFATACVAAVLYEDPHGAIILSGLMSNHTAATDMSGNTSKSSTSC